MNKDLKNVLIWLPFLVFGFWIINFAVKHSPCTNETREGWFIERRVGFDVFIGDKEEARNLAPNSRIYFGTDYYRICK